MQLSYPNKGCREPASPVTDTPPPPILIWAIQYSDEITSLEHQLLRIKGHMVPESLSINNHIFILGT